MKMHVYHDSLPGYSASQIFHDGCPECEDRGKSRGLGLGQLDRYNFERAWQRAAAWNTAGLPDISHAERALLDALWSVQVHLERRGVPIGQVPDGQG